MYISHNEKQVPVGRQRSGREPEGGGGVEHRKVRSCGQSRAVAEVKKGGDEHE